MVQIIERVLNIMEILADEGEMSLTELAKTMALPKGTTYRLLQSLKAKDYVNQDQTNRKYRLSLKIANIGNKILGNVDLRVEARPILEKLLDETKESIHLAILQGEEVVFIDSLPSLYSLQVHHKLPGERGFAHCTAVGKVLLAYSSPLKVKRVIEKGLPGLTSNTITSASDLKKHLEIVRRQSFAIDNEESEKGCRCIASPIRDYKGKVIAALSITGPSIRITEDRFEHLARKVKCAANEVSDYLGFTFDKRK